MISRELASHSFSLIRSTLTTYVRHERSANNAKPPRSSDEQRPASQPASQNPSKRRQTEQGTITEEPLNSLNDEESAGKHDSDLESEPEDDKSKHKLPDDEELERGLPDDDEPEREQPGDNTIQGIANQLELFEAHRMAYVEHGKMQSRLAKTIAVVVVKKNKKVELDPELIDFVDAKRRGFGCCTLLVGWRSTATKLVCPSCLI